MSSKLYRNDDGVEPVVHVWRSAGTPGGARAGAGAAVRPPGSGGNDAAAEAEARLQAVQKQAYAAGEQAGTQKAMERLIPALAAFESMTKQLAGMSSHVRQEAEVGTVQLAVAIARRVLHRELAVDPEAVLGLVKSAGARLNAREVRRLRVAPDDARAISEHRAALNLPQGLEVLADPSLPRGSAIFETTRGEMDASVGTQLDEIERGLTDLVRRRS